MVSNVLFSWINYYVTSVLNININGMTGCLFIMCSFGYFSLFVQQSDSYIIQTEWTKKTKKNSGKQEKSITVYLPYAYENERTYITFTFNIIMYVFLQTYDTSRQGDRHRKRKRNIYRKLHAFSSFCIKFKYFLRPRIGF